MSNVVRSLTSNDCSWSLAASTALSTFQSTDRARLLPTIVEVTNDASRLIAISLAQQAIDEGLASLEQGCSVTELINQQQWFPAYIRYRYQKT